LQDDLSLSTSAEVVDCLESWFHCLLAHGAVRHGHTFE
jgi:hypothetical protein